MENHEWGGYIFREVSKEVYENFRRYKKGKIEGDYFMGWYDSYDWSLRSGKYKIGTWENAGECMVARCFWETPDPEYYIREDYVDIDNMPFVPEEPKPELTEKQQKLVDAICRAVDAAFRYQAMEDTKK